ncbi:ArsO family NAD(P)H-dependent flavin-containing monooxygenase [Arthrobacter roseus]|uniref:ArsO family NAD(P)H-dependent flavin-containing monooxygenase n=1 Tax=Arthrobacter roseus TaxID=136274 RepID=UPI00196644F9|nr:ArsO family NAD(P)H-dependent flavin-containing monooxygenase [Arthrobacter roseus]MBM7847033.1 cation diffusion facilitator CzcD-associated flavoprotein CzcO [Arthrobacter roseus]
MFDVVVIGGGQAGLAAGYYLRRAGLDFVILDDQPEPGGAWRHTWDSLTLFSPSQYSSLPGRMMPVWEPGYPPSAHVLEYLESYEDRYALPVERPVTVTSVQAEDDGGFTVTTGAKRWRGAAVVNATGTYSQPYTPAVPGAESFTGRQLHSATYRGPAEFGGQRVAVVGGGNSGAQIVADLHAVADTSWFTLREPKFMPDDVDGRVLFSVASARVRAVESGEADAGSGGLGDIVAVPPVRGARDAGALDAQPMFLKMTPTGVQRADVDGGAQSAEFDAVIWCTGFRPVLHHLDDIESHLRARGASLRDRQGHMRLEGLESAVVPGLYFLGYGDWTGPGSATLFGAGRTARQLVRALQEKSAEE